MAAETVDPRPQIDDLFVRETSFIFCRSSPRRAASTAPSQGDGGRCISQQGMLIHDN
jgi:hypothetical protein